MLTFTSITQHKRGILASLLVRSYAAIPETDPQFWDEERSKWHRFDREAFDNPDTVGKCVFVTCLDGRPIGFGSFDPRPAPELGRIGHNCILPEFRGRGFGKNQIDEILRRLSRLGVRKAAVSTGDHPFFLPARKMYEACGFRETGWHMPDPNPGFGIIEYEREMQPFSGGPHEVD